MPDYRIGGEMARIIEDVDEDEDGPQQILKKVVTSLENAGKDAIEVDVCRTECPHCGGETMRTAQAAGTVFLGVALLSRVFNAENEEYAAEAFRREIADVYPDADLEIVNVSEIEDDIDAEA